nr:uncharacterized protein LOC101885516 [Danio rerio]|eukprot:XP_009299522.1 uncharacterized protein LOC101885516 [Danio rerio]
MDFLDSFSTLLSTSTGMYVCCQSKPPTSYQLVATEQQNPERFSKVKVYRFVDNENKICMAFCFKTGKHSVFPVITHSDEVDFKTLTSDEIAKGKVHKSFLFKPGEGSNSPFMSLKSVYKPDKYLCVDQNERSKVTLYSEDMPDFKIDDLCKHKELQRTNCQPLSRILDQTTSSREKSVEPSKCSNRKGKRMKFSLKSCVSFCR